MNKYEQLPAYIESAKPFAWGENDCCSFAANWMVALGYADPMAAVRGYKTAKQAMRLYEDGLLPFVVDVLGEPLENPLMAQRGDVAVVEMADAREAVGIVVGELVAIPGKEGLGYIPLTAALAAWRI